MTIGQFVKDGNLRVGLRIFFKNPHDESLGDIIIGDATEYNQDSTNDDGYGWDWDDDREIVEVVDLLEKG